MPYRFSERGLEFCLITSRKSGRWGFPKGGIRRNETANDAAVNEALEEAGLVGRIVGQSIGSFEYSKQQRQLIVSVMLLAVDLTMSEWLESKQRLRRWVTVQEAQQLLDRPTLLSVLHAAITMLKRQAGGSTGIAAAGA